MAKLHKSSKDPELYYYFNRKKEKLWCFRHKYYDELGERKEKKRSSFTTEKEALRVLLEVKALTLRGSSRQIEYDSITVEKWFDLWYDTYNQQWKKSTCYHRKALIKNHIKPLLGSYKLSKLDKTTYRRAFINKLLDKGFSPNTVKLFHCIFNTAINAAVDDEVLPHNRFRKVKITKADTFENFLTPNELNTFLDTAKEYVSVTGYTLMHLLAYTGLRKGEAYGLKWKNIDFDKRTITVECTRDHYGPRSPKTKNSYRTIPVDEVVTSQLKFYQRRCMEAKLKFGMQLNKEDDFVFISEQSGEPCSYTLLQHAFTALYKYLELKDIKIKKITAHGLRHTHATILINKRISPKTIADRLGNTVEMIYKVYAHSFKELEDTAVTVFSESLNGAKIGAN